jgi:signal transduction histidine kinase
MAKINWRRLALDARGTMALLPWSQPVILGLGFAILAIIAASAVWLTDQATTEQELVTHTLGVENDVARLHLLVRQAESSQRGYLLTGESSYLAGYHDAIGQVGPTLDEIARQTADNPVQQQESRALRPAIAEKLAELARTIALNESGQSAQALELVRTGIGQKRMREIEVGLGRMGRIEQSLLEARTTESRHVRTRLIAVNLAGVLLLIVLGIASTALIHRSNRRQRAAQQALADTNAGLELTIAERTADLREANEEVQRFASIVTHDLRSPLVNIMGFTSELAELRKALFERVETLRKSAGPDAPGGDDESLAREFDEAITFIKASIGKMDRLIQAVLTISREGRREFHPEEVDVAALIASTAATLNHQTTERGASIRIGELPPVVSDRLALDQIFSNLLDNAVKYLRDGVAGRIEVRGRIEGPGAIFEIEDNGRGIDPKDHQRIFELFRRAGAQDQPGEGIGLAHVRALVRRLGGTLSVSSEPGRGSIFRLMLPRRLSATRERKAA